MRGEADNDFQGDWSESDMDFSPFARQLTITRAKELIRRHTKKFRSRGQKGLFFNFMMLILFFVCAVLICFVDNFLFFGFHLEEYII